MNFILKCEQEVDGRGIAELPEPPSVLSQADSAAGLMFNGEILALRVIAPSL